MAELKKKLGYPTILVLTLLPTVIWYNLQPISARFSSLGSVLASAGQLFGLAGLVLFALALLLNTRLRFLEAYFGGQDRVYRAHHLIGTLAFVLLAFHPLLLSFRYVQVSLKSAALFLLPGNDFAINFGIYALTVMEALLIITFFIKLKYNKWRFSHQFLGVAFILASIHIYFISSDISGSNILRYYILSFVLIGIASYAYKTVFGKILVKKYVYAVEKVLDLGENITEITLRPLKQKMIHAPGQFIFISFKSKSLPSEAHPFTISSSPSEENLRLSVKSLGDYTSQIKSLNMGDTALVEGPFGRFRHDLSKEKDQVWVAGGIGITPFLSMARALNGNHGKIELYYCTANEKEAVFLKELSQISRTAADFRIIPFCSSEKGRISAETIKSQSEIESTEIFICGPPAMMNALKAGFIKLKVSPHRIHMEEFSLQ